MKGYYKKWHIGEILENYFHRLARIFSRKEKKKGCNDTSAAKDAFGMGIIGRIFSARKIKLNK